jgi:FkbM family methyltransferase
MNLKEIVRSILIFLHLDLTKNLEYDRLTNLIMKRVIRRDANCIDIGCHKGEILQAILKYAPDGRHFAFEPIPYLFLQLGQKFAGKALIYPFALSDQTGETTFQLVKNAPAYSGINRRKYNIAHPDIEEINVQLRTLDELIPVDLPIDFIKIDVEGAEFGVLKGSVKLIKRWKPVVVFEFGMGASDYYGTDPEALYTFLVGECGLKIYTLKAYINNGEALTEARFVACYRSNGEYYFIASRT